MAYSQIHIVQKLLGLFFSPSLLWWCTFKITVDSFVLICFHLIKRDVEHYFCLFAGSLSTVCWCLSVPFGHFSFILLLKLSINQINTFDSCFDIIYSLYRNLYFWPHKKTQFSPCNTELKTKDLPLKWVFDNFVLGLIHLQMGLLPECCTNPFLVSAQTPSSLEQEEVLFRSAEYKYWRQFITVCVYLGNN